MVRSSPGKERSAVGKRSGSYPRVQVKVAAVGWSRRPGVLLTEAAAGPVWMSR